MIRKGMRGRSTSRLPVTAAFSLAVLLAGCTGNGASPPLRGTLWTLAEIQDGTGSLVPVLAGTSVTAIFSADGQLTGSAGCNRYFAVYSIDGEQIAVSGAGATMMFCGSPGGLMEQESRFLSRLAAATSFSISGTTLTLRGSGGEPLLVFREGTG